MAEPVAFMVTRNASLNPEIADWIGVTIGRAGDVVMPATCARLVPSTAIDFVAVVFAGPLSIVAYATSLPDGLILTTNEGLAKHGSVAGWNAPAVVGKRQPPTPVRYALPWSSTAIACATSLPPPPNLLA